MLDSCWHACLCDSSRFTCVILLTTQSYLYEHWTTSSPHGLSTLEAREEAREEAILSSMLVRWFTACNYLLSAKNSPFDRHSLPTIPSLKHTGGN